MHKIDAGYLTARLSRPSSLHSSQTHPDVFIMESYNEDQETPGGQADGTVED